MNKNLISKITFLFLAFVLFLTSFNNVYADSQDYELFEFGIILTYAGLCVKTLNIQEDALSQRDDQQLLNVLAERYGIEKLANLEAVAVMGVQEFESDHGARCKQFLLAGKKC